LRNAAARSRFAGRAQKDRENSPQAVLFEVSAVLAGALGVTLVLNFMLAALHIG
jgi:hypothetical protein